MQIRPGGYIVLTDVYNRVTDEVVSPLGWVAVKVPTVDEVMQVTYWGVRVLPLVLADDPCG